MTSPLRFSKIGVFDWDGGLVDYPGGADTRRPFCREAIRCLKWLLEVEPDMGIIHSTDRRLRGDDRQEMIQMWEAAGLPIDRWIGYTMDLRPVVNSYALRGHEILHELKALDWVRKPWAVADDMILGVRPVLGDDRCVFTDPRFAMTMTNAVAFREKLNAPHGPIEYPLPEDDSEL